MKIKLCNLKFINIEKQFYKYLGQYGGIVFEKWVLELDENGFRIEIPTSFTDTQIVLNTDSGTEITKKVILANKFGDKLRFNVVTLGAEVSNRYFIRHNGK